MYHRYTRTKAKHSKLTGFDDVLKSLPPTLLQLESTSQASSPPDAPFI